MQFKTLLSIYVAIIGAAALDVAVDITDDPLSQLPTCAKSRLTAAFAATGCTSQTDTACWCPNTNLKGAVTNVVGTKTICSTAADRKLIGDLWNEQCPENTIKSIV